MARKLRHALDALPLPRFGLPKPESAFVRPAYRRRAMRLRQRLTAGLFALALAATSLCALRLATRMDSAVVLAAREMPSVASHQYQEDPAWSGDPMGNSGKALGKHGDSVACLAALIEMQSLPSPVSGPLNPGTLNAWLSENEAYDGKGNILWDRVAALLGVKMICKAPQRGMEALLEELIQAEIYPIVTVRRPDTGGMHDVLAAGSVHGEFIVMDPLDPMDVLDTLGLYDNRIYGMRYFDRGE